jgi:DNA-binding response OmpR family regulator
MTQPGLCGRIAVLGRDSPYLEQTASHLIRNGFLAEVYTDATTLLSQTSNKAVSLVLVDAAGWTARDQIEAVLRIQTEARVPCILRVHTADDPSERVYGLENGLDDWIPADATPREVLVRIRAALEQVHADWNRCALPKRA